MSSVEESTGKSRMVQTKEFVLYQRVFFGSRPKLRRIFGKLEMPVGIGEVKRHFQNTRLYGVSVLFPLTYVQDDDGIFKPEDSSLEEYSSVSRFRLDSIVLAHSLKAEDSRSKNEIENSTPIAIKTRFADGVIKGDISYVPALKKVERTEQNLPILEKHLKDRRFIALYAFSNNNIEDLFRHEEHWDSMMYKKPHCIIVSTNTITEYGFQR